MKVKKTVYSDVDSDEDLEDNTAKDEGWPGGPMLVNLSSFFLSAVTVFAMQLISSHLDKDLSHLKSRRLLKERNLRT